VCGVWGGGQGGSGNLRGGLQNFTEPLPRNMNIFLESSAQAQSSGILLGDLI